MSVGFHSLMADGLGAALKSLELVTPDLVITDLMMPDGSGADLMLALSRAAKWRDIPVLLVTGSDPARCQEELLRCAARPERILKKPFRLDELLELAEQLIAKRPRDALRDVD